MGAADRGGPSPVPPPRYESESRKPNGLRGRSRSDTVRVRGMSRNTRPLKISARGAPYAHMIKCPSSLEVRRIDRRADSTTAPRYLPSQKLGPELGVKGRRVRTPQGAHQRPLRRNGCRGRLPPTDHPVTSFNRLLAPCPRRAQTAGDSRPIADSSGWPRPAQSRGPPRWIARIKLVPKLTVRVRFPSPAPCSNSVAVQANPTYLSSRSTLIRVRKRHSCHCACH